MTSRDPIGGGILRRLQGLRRREDGSVSVEFVVLGPVFLLLLFGVLELAVISMSVTGLRVGLEDVGRAIRTGQAQCVSDVEVAQVVCASAFSSACQADLDIVRERFAVGAAADQVSVEDWDALDADDIVLLTAGYDWPILTPLMSPFLGEDGHVRISSTVVFKNEGFDNASCS